MFRPTHTEPFQGRKNERLIIWATDFAFRRHFGTAPIHDWINNLANATQMQDMSERCMERRIGKGLTTG